MSTSPALDSLPNELLNSILSQLPTTSLLPLAAVSHHFHSVTLRILKQRLDHATRQPDHRLMLECYHPSEKLYTPYLYCDYLYTDSFGEEADAKIVSHPQQRHPGTPEDFHGLAGIYSHFRPVEQDDDEPRKQRARHPRRQQQQQEQEQQEQQQEQEQEADEKEPQRPPPPPSLDIYLDEDQSFSQLCTTTNLVRLGPKPGLFRSHVNVSEGVMRVWRDWLAGRASSSGQRRTVQGDGNHCEGGRAVLWADAARDVGVRFRVTEKDIRGQHPVLVANDEQLSVAYRLEFEELVVRSSTLLVMAEKSEVQEVAAEGKAVVLAWC